MQNLRIADYRIEEELGRGGMGVVYRGVELTTGDMVAIKVLSREFALDPAYVKRFTRETEALAKLDHPNIVKIHAVGEDQGSHYYVMEFVDGRSLGALLNVGERFDVGRALDLAIEVAVALGHAHKAGIIHRDIKPGNILIDKNGKPKLTDFGVARLTYATRMTRTGDIVGTPEYMSPEQSRGSAVDKSSDVYSLGVVVYELLAGKVPFDGATALQIIQKHQYEEPENIKNLNRAIPEGLARVVMRMLAKGPKERYKSAEQAATALSMIRPTVIRKAVAKEKMLSATPSRVKAQEAEIGVVRPKVLSAKRCPQCQTELSSRDRICIACGIDVATGRSVKELALKHARKRLLIKVATTIGAVIPLLGCAAVVTLLMGIYYVKLALLLSVLFCIVTLAGGSIRREPVLKRLYVGILLGLLVAILYGLLWTTAPPFSPLQPPAPQVVSLKTLADHT